jgi:hypothetical protein
MKVHLIDGQAIEASHLAPGIEEPVTGTIETMTIRLYIFLSCKRGS